MNQRHLHVVAFDVPDPPDYGGATEIFYKIVALHSEGVLVHLHCFEYGRIRSKYLETICYSVTYYKRKSVFSSMFGWLPYIVSSRKNKQLLQNLAADGHPVLFEGLHTCGFLHHPLLDHKLKAVRMHNVEWKYYNGLASNTPLSIKWLYYKVESFRLKKFESALRKDNLVLTISQADQAYFSGHSINAHLLNPFHGHRDVLSKQGKGEYFLYHGNLAVEENEIAALWLADHYTGSNKLIIAGKSPSKKLQSRLADEKHIELISNPDGEMMQTLVAEAHVHVLPAFQSSGIKLKLIRSLFEGRFILANPAMLEGTGLDFLSEVFTNSEEMNRKILELDKQSFNANELESRKAGLVEFSDSSSVKKLISLLFRSES